MNVLVNVNYTESNRQEGMTERIDMNVLVNVNGLTEPKSSGEMTGTHNRSGQGGGGGGGRGCLCIYCTSKDGTVN